MSDSSAALVRISRFSPASATSCGKAGEPQHGRGLALRADGAAICGRADASAPERGDAGVRIGDGADIEDTGAAGAARDGAAPPEATGDPPPFWSSILIASSGVGRSAT